MCVNPYRYQYDPNGRVRDAMAHIWVALVPEPRAALDAHFGAIADELLREMGGRMWRNREAACLGLADLLQVGLCHAQRAGTGDLYDMEDTFNVMRRWCRLRG